MIFIQPGTNSNERMMSYIPDFFKTSRIMNELMRTRGFEIEQVIQAYDEILDQFFIQTATWYLEEYEKQHGLPINKARPIEDRRKRVLSKRRSGRANLLGILQAEEPTITQAWGGNILPFTIHSDEDPYPFKEIVRLLKAHAPSHLGYSFKIINSDGGSYTVGMSKKSRFLINHELKAGSTDAGVYPWSYGKGDSKKDTVTVERLYHQGTGDYQLAGNLYVSDKKVSSTSGNVTGSTVNVASIPVIGSGDYQNSNSFIAGESPDYERSGSSVGGQVEVETINLAGTGETRMNCGNFAAGEEVA
ncbi:DUF2313 domain-containing protein [Halobacillus trueperi]|uniref:DUF2313 domain-containing protein n=1 Tax=Halobacillus trueperi TaxID=156205 RepID=A0A3D8VLV5_9BACI|nr:putative phage tail protein [Halobacillus trueperi]RDY70330.1 DUF2313 domain-containing protein [Halobacillus trueperi]